MPVTIYHNPACGTSRNTLAMIRASGEEPEVIEYLKTPRSEEHTSELQSRFDIVCRLLLVLRLRSLPSPIFPYPTLFRSSPSRWSTACMSDNSPLQYMDGLPRCL